MRTELDSVDDRIEQVVLPKSDLRKSLNYLRNHWAELTRYLNDPLLPIDNNECGQLIRQVGLGRKGRLFCGGLAGGERNAGFLTLVSSAHRNDLDTWSYVNDVLRQLLAGKTNYEPLLHWNWAASHPNHIRQAERRERQIRNEKLARKAPPKTIPQQIGNRHCRLRIHNQLTTALLRADRALLHALCVRIEWRAHQKV